MHEEGGPIDRESLRDNSPTTRVESWRLNPSPANDDHQCES
jgi:hypothetical protein